jgi:hypothetical protein
MEQSMPGYTGGLGIAARHVAARNNLLLNASIGLEDHPVVGMSDDVTICSNSSYSALTAFAGGSATNVVLKSNVFHTTTDLSYAQGLYFSTPLSELEIDNNVYYAPNKAGPLTFPVEDTAYGQSGFDSWQATGMDVHGMMADPRYVSTDFTSPDFLKLAEDSPCRGAGAAPGSAAPAFVDFDGNARTVGLATDAGAWLYGTLAVMPLGPSRQMCHGRGAVRGDIVCDLLGKRAEPGARGSGLRLVRWRGTVTAVVGAPRLAW